MSTPITLEALDRASERKHLNLSALSKTLGRDRSWLRLRILRGSPEITEEESERIAAELAKDGISLRGTA